MSETKGSPVTWAEVVCLWNEERERGNTRAPLTVQHNGQQRNFFSLLYPTEPPELYVDRIRTARGKRELYKRHSPMWDFHNATVQANLNALRDALKPWRS